NRPRRSRPAGRWRPWARARRAIRWPSCRSGRAGCYGRSREMDWITDKIAIGNYLEAQDLDLLRKEAIQSGLGLTDALAKRDAAALGLRQLVVVPLVDGPGNDIRLFRRAVDALAWLAEEAAPVLVHCHAGKSRSVVTVAGYLMTSRGIESEEALAQ